MGRLTRSNRLIDLGVALVLFHAMIATPVIAQDEATLDRQFQSHYAAGRYVEAASAGKQLLAIAERNPGDPLRLAVRSQNLANTYDHLGRYAEAEKLLLQAIEIRERQVGSNALDLARCMDSLGCVRLNQLAYEDAERLLQRAMTIREGQLGRNHPEVAASLNNMAIVATESGKLQEAEQYYLRSLDIKQKQNPINELDIAATKNNLSTLYQKLGRHSDGERVIREGLEIRQRKLPPTHPDIATSLNNLGIALVDQGRYAEAEGLLVKALKIRQQTLPPTHIWIASTLNALGIVYSHQGRFVEAEDHYRRALRMRQEILGGDHGEVLHSFNNLAILYKEMKRFEESARLYKRLVSLCETAGNRPADAAIYSTNLANMLEAQGEFASAEAAARRGLDFARQIAQQNPQPLERSLRTLCSILCNQKRFADAEPLATEIAKRLTKDGSSPGDQFRIQFLQARVADGLGHREEAIRLLTAGLDMAEQQRILSALDPEGRAAAFSEVRSAIESLLEWQAQAKDYSGLLRTRERARARSLSDQLTARRIDPTDGMTNTDSARLRARQKEAQTQLASYEVQLGAIRKRGGAISAETSQQIADLEEKIASARRNVVQVYRESYQANPAWREIMTARQEEVSIARTQEWLRKHKALLLDFYVGDRTIALLTLSGEGDPTWNPLSIDESLAKSIGVTPGVLGLVNLDQVLTLGDRQVIQRLAKGDDSSSMRQRLSELFQVLLPTTVREALLGGTYEHVFVIPDGPLSLLPLETLITQMGDSPTYLLDVGPPITYLPSLSWLFNSMADSPPGIVGKQRLLTIGDPVYSAASQSGLSVDSGKARFNELGRELARLPFTAAESKSVAEGFEKSGASVTSLIGPAATEAAIRSQSPGKTVVHFACHGLVDQLYGNFFGALAVTPGKSVTDTSDDGMLTLAEIYGLNLKGCDLAILSACQTNFGPQQSGEGTWALSRGFLVAGARRTVASNWLVDDEAGAYLVSYFTTAVASDSAKGAASYSRRLLEAKRYIRQHDKWNNPYYWSGFVLIGPD